MKPMRQSREPSMLFTNSLNIECWQKCIDQEGDFVGKCTDLIAGWCVPFHAFTLL